MRKRAELNAPRTELTQEAPRLAALTDADLKSQRSNRSWIPAAARETVLDPSHWSRRARQDQYWRMVEIWNAPRSFH